LPLPGSRFPKAHLVVHSRHILCAADRYSPSVAVSFRKWELGSYQYRGKGKIPIAQNGKTIAGKHANSVLHDAFTSSFRRRFPRTRGSIICSVDVGGRLGNCVDVCFSIPSRPHLFILPPRTFLGERNIAMADDHPGALPFSCWDPPLLNVKWRRDTKDNPPTSRRPQSLSPHLDGFVTAFERAAHLE